MAVRRTLNQDPDGVILGDRNRMGQSKERENTGEAADLRRTRFSCRAHGAEVRLWPATRVMPECENHRGGDGCGHRNAEGSMERKLRGDQREGDPEIEPGSRGREGAEGQRETPWGLSMRGLRGQGRETR